MPRSFCNPISRFWGKHMKRAKSLLLGVVCLFALAAFAADANVGNWKLNDAKSKIPAGSSKNTEVSYTTVGDQFKGTTDGVDGTGKPTHSEWTGKFDGKDYPLTGTGQGDSRAIKKIDDHHYSLAVKKDGKATITGTITL